MVATVEDGRLVAPRSPRARVSAHDTPCFSIISRTLANRDGAQTARISRRVAVQTRTLAGRTPKLAELRDGAGVLECLDPVPVHAEFHQHQLRVL